MVPYHWTSSLIRFSDERNSRGLWTALYNRRTKDCLIQPDPSMLRPRQHMPGRWPELSTQPGSALKAREVAKLTTPVDQTFKRLNLQRGATRCNTFPFEPSKKLLLIVNLLVLCLPAGSIQVESGFSDVDLSVNVNGAKIFIFKIKATRCRNYSRTNYFANFFAHCTLHFVIGLL